MKNNKIFDEFDIMRLAEVVQRLTGFRLYWKDGNDDEYDCCSIVGKDPNSCLADHVNGYFNTVEETKKFLYESRS